MSEGAYTHLEAEVKKPKRLVDHTAKWEAFQTVADTNGIVGQRLSAFCESKRIRIEDLTALGARVVERKGGDVHLAFAGENDAGSVTAIKYRPLGGSSHDSRAEPPSTWMRPIIVGKRDSLEWFVAEGETDTARLYGLVGDDVQDGSSVAVGVGEPARARRGARLGRA